MPKTLSTSWVPDTALTACACSLPTFTLLLAIPLLGETPTGRSGANVFGWTIEAYEGIVDRLRELPFTNRDSRNFVRMVTAGSFEETLDKQGRVMIPPKLREWAYLDREVTVIGAGNRFEIWDSARWDEFFESQEEPFADLSDEVMPGIF